MPLIPKSWNLCFGLVNMSWYIFNGEVCIYLAYALLVTMILMHNLCTHVRVFWMFSFTSKIMAISAAIRIFSSTFIRILDIKFMHKCIHLEALHCVSFKCGSLLPGPGVKDGQIDHLITYTLLPLRPCESCALKKQQYSPFKSSPVIVDSLEPMPRE